MRAIVIVAFDESTLRTFRHLAPDSLQGCPVDALGVWGEFHFLRDALGQRHALRPKDFTRRRIFALFGRSPELLVDRWPRLNAKGLIAGWDHELVAETLIAAAARVGVVDPERLGFSVAYRSPPQGASLERRRA